MTWSAIWNIIILILQYFVIILTLSIVFTVVICLIFQYYIEGTPGICRCTTRLDGKVVLVTGGNTGIGLETARNLAKRGAKVIIASRNVEKSANAVKDIIASTGNENVEYKHLDLASFKSVREFAEDFNRSYDRLEILINNAGLITQQGEITDDGIEKIFLVNYLGPFLLTNLLMEKLIKSKPSRIIIVSSCMHFFTFNVQKLEDIMVNSLDIVKYANSKLCGVLWTKALAKRLPEGVTVNSLHPGAIATDIFNNAPWYYMIILKLAFMIITGKTVAEGAQTTVHVAVCEDLKDVSGQYFKDCKINRYSSKANNDKLVETLWCKSLIITKSELPEHLLKKI